MVGPGQLPPPQSLPSTCTPSSPLVDHFKFDAFGLDGPSEAAVAAVDAEFELLLELYSGNEDRPGRKEGGVRLWFQVLSAWGWGASWQPRPPPPPPPLTGGVCVLNHTGLVFLSFFLEPNQIGGRKAQGLGPALGPLPAHSRG